MATKQPNNEVAKRDTTTGRFLPGAPGSRNGGRPMLPPELKALCQGAAPEAIAVAIKLYKDEQQPAGARIKACEVILDRAYGKAPQSVDVTTGGEQIQQVTIVEIVSPALPLRQAALPEPE